MAAPCERAVWRTWTAPEWPMRADWNCDVNRDGALMSWPTHRPTSGAGLAPKPLLVGGSSDLQSIRELDNGRSCEWAFRDGDVGQVDRRNRSGMDCSLAVPMQRTIADELPLLPLGWRLTLSEGTRIDVDGVYALGVGRGGGR
jgi:hypothetical protein